MCVCVCVKNNIKEGDPHGSRAPMVCVCVCVCDVFVGGLATFNALAALATGGLGVGGLEPACGLPYPTPGRLVCRGAAEGRLPWAMCPPQRPS